MNNSDLLVWTCGDYDSVLETSHSQAESREQNTIKFRDMATTECVVQLSHVENAEKFMPVTGFCRHLLSAEAVYQVWLFIMYLKGTQAQLL